MNRFGKITIGMFLVMLLAASHVLADESPIAKALQPFVQSGNLPGAVALVVGPDGVLMQDAVGYADLAKKTPMRNDTVFWIASMTKPMTAVAFMMLVDEGKASLDDPVSKYIPQMKDLWVVTSVSGDRATAEKLKRPITLRHLLSHTSGLPFLTPMQMKDLSCLSPELATLAFTMAPLQSQPGDKFQYSNEGIDTISRVIEIISGMPYEKFMQTRLFDPLGMKETTFFPTAEQASRLAKVYGPNEKKNGYKETSIPLPKPPFDRAGHYPEAAGGLFSTGHDLAQFCRMLLNGGTLDGHCYLSPAAMAELQKDQTGKLKKNYSLGFYINEAYKAFGHSGAAGTNMMVSPENKLAVVWLVQRSGFIGDGGNAEGAFFNAAIRFSPAEK